MRYTKKMKRFAIEHLGYSEHDMDILGTSSDMMRFYTYNTESPKIYIPSIRKNVYKAKQISASKAFKICGIHAFMAGICMATIRQKDHDINLDGYTNMVFRNINNQ